MLVGWLVLSLVVGVLGKYTCRQYSAGHITCKRRNPVCQVLDDHRLNLNERHEIIEAHNQIRREAAKGLLRRFGLPEAANMKKLEWDADLANNAQAHVEVTCRLNHDQPWQRVTGAYPDVGQNVYITEVKYQELKQDNWTKVIENLWGKGEAPMLTAGSFGKGLTLRGLDLHSTGHLTQLLWANTEKVGCGKIIFDNHGGSSDLRTCDYGEGGNVIGAEMYIVGPACSACPASHPYCEDGLCSRIPPATFSYTGNSYKQSRPNYYRSSTTSTRQSSNPTSYSDLTLYRNPTTFSRPTTYSSSAQYSDYQTHNAPQSYRPAVARANQNSAQYSWWNPASRKTSQSQTPYYNTFQANYAGSAHLQAAYQPNTYNYQGYTVLQRKRRNVRLPLSSTRVL